MKQECDILVVGAGPAGLTAAWEAAASGDRRVLLIDAGPDLSERRCPALRARVCPSCRHCDLLQGVGGASGIVGGKLCYFPAGERLARHVGMTAVDANGVFSGVMNRLEMMLPEPVQTAQPRRSFLSGRALSGLELKAYEAFPVLSDDLRLLFATLRQAAVQSGVDLRAETRLQSLRRGAGSAAFEAQLDCGCSPVRVSVRESVVLATGRSTAPWLARLLDDVGAAVDSGTVDVGVRLECDASRLADFLFDFEDPKLLHHPGTPREVRTLCWCRGGSMTVTSMAGYQLVDGHFGDAYSDRSSVSVVARRPVPTGRHPLEHAASLASYAPRQRPMQIGLAEFLGKNSLNRSRTLPVLGPCRTDPMRLASLSPELLQDLREFLFTMMDLAGDELLDDRTAVVFGPVIDQQWPVPRLNQRLQTNVPGLYVAGDIQGRARGIVQAIFSGWVVGRAIRGADAHLGTVSGTGARA